MLAGTTLQPDHFAQAKQQLFILTGIEPKQTHGRVGLLSRADHLRFTFREQGKDFYRVKALLKLLDIPHQADLYKRIGVNAQNETVLEYFITVAQQQFSVLQSYFLPGAMLKLGDLKGKQFKIHDRDGPLKTALTEILFDPQFHEELKKRNNNTYSLDGLMYYFAQLTMNSMPCFQYLQSAGMVAEFNIELKVSSQEKSPPTPDEFDAPAPIIVAYDQRMKNKPDLTKTRSSTAAKRGPKSK